MTKGDKQRQKSNIKGFLAWVNADEDLDDETKIKFDDEDADEEFDLVEAEGEFDDDKEELHLREDEEKAQDYNEMPSNSGLWKTVKADDSTLVNYEGDDEFDYPDEIIVIDELVSIHNNMTNSNHGIRDGYMDNRRTDRNANRDDMEIDYADSIPVHQEAVHLTKKEKRRLGRFRVFYLALSAIVALNVIGVLLLTVNFLPPFGEADNPAVNEVYTRYVVDSVAETGALNMVSAVLYSYRSFDTLGEAFVLFTAAIGVIMLLQETKDTPKPKDKANKNHE